MIFFVLISITNLFSSREIIAVDENLDKNFKHAARIIYSKCADCHSSSGVLPFYAHLPLARKLIEKDINDGIERFNFDNKFLGNGENFSELDLARLESVIYANSMSPMRYRILHWNSGLNKSERESIQKWIYALREEKRAQQGFIGKRLGEPISPLVVDKNLDENKVLLGNLLFHDKRLSKDDTISCASCHDLNKGGTDRAISSTGINGQLGPINAPTVFNAVYNHRQFWDGRASDLEEQAGGPVTNPLEMGAEWNHVLAKLKKDQSLVTRFEQNYQDGLNKSNILNAIATFERSLVTPNSRFDQYLLGNDNILSESELRGYQHFKSNCISCHAGPGLGGLSFEKLGLKKNYFKARGRKPMPADMGLANFTHNQDDKHKFKVPTLRNIELTAPYFHDGSVKNLEDAIELMAKHQVGKKLKKEEIGEIAAFLRTLNGEYQGKSLQ